MNATGETHTVKDKDRMKSKRTSLKQGCIILTIIVLNHQTCGRCPYFVLYLSFWL
uniref:Uncharacterized protein n=1 Tax=Anguilla anguilla TaxID=7936 RepID=A0A0E9W9C1_ANGAN